MTSVLYNYHEDEPVMDAQVKFPQTKKCIRISIITLGLNFSHSQRCQMNAADRNGQLVKVNRGKWSVKMIDETRDWRRPEGKDTFQERIFDIIYFMDYCDN